MLGIRLFTTISNSSRSQFTLLADIFTLDRSIGLVAGGVEGMGKGRRMGKGVMMGAKELGCLRPFLMTSHTSHTPSKKDRSAEIKFRAPKPITLEKNSTFSRVVLLGESE